MKRTATIIYLCLLISGLILTSCNEEKTDQQKDQSISQNHNHDEMMKKMKTGNDTRISLNLSPEKAHHQLMNMQSHVLAVQSIITHLSKDEFEKAAEVASSKLGLTPEMKMMCTSFENEEFVKMGLEFHQSADKMSDVLKTKDKNKSLMALSTTMNYCVNCHSTFKQ